jgi:hypothetical protein
MQVCAYAGTYTCTYTYPMCILPETPRPHNLLVFVLQIHVELKHMLHTKRLSNFSTSSSTQAQSTSSVRASTLHGAREKIVKFFHVIIDSDSSQHYQSEQAHYMGHTERWSILFHVIIDSDSVIGIGKNSREIVFYIYTDICSLQK